ncbi:MAG: hypothetical protein E7654_06860 [Ruminococcaceae bacterium]|nr:hypothetical protein [Oscillospiraceae bacterium]
MSKPIAKSVSPLRFTLGYLLFAGIFVLCTLILLHLAQYGEKDTAGGAADADSMFMPCIVLDAGHGGEDGGTVGVDGLLEKTVNLKVAEALENMLKLSGIPVVMTRTEDKMLSDPDAAVGGKRKMTDLRSRLKIAQNTPEGILVSIHMNSFSQAQYRGLQVYYSPNHRESAILAQTVQDGVRTYLQPDNHRKIKPADSSIYLLAHCDRPAVLIECGFLSNPEECALLGNEEYLGELSMVIFAAVCDYLTPGESRT